MVVNLKYKFKPFVIWLVKEIEQFKKRKIMRKLGILLILTLGVVHVTEGQQRRKLRKAKFTTEQKVELAVKKMTLALDLTSKQQKEVAPLLAKQIKNREAHQQKRMEARKTEKRPTAEEMFAIQSQRLDNQIVFKKNMKTILNKGQFERFKKMNHQRNKEMKERLKDRMEKGQKRRRMRRWMQGRNE